MIITGGSSGIGRSAATQLGSLGADLILVGRSPEKYRAVQSDLDGQGAANRLVAADFGNLSSVVTAAGLIVEAHGSEKRLILINNAATAGRRGVTDDGFELAFGVNYFAHFLLTSLLLEAKLAIARIINVTSNAHYSTTGLDPGLALGKTRSFLGWREYSHSKAAMAAMSVELAERNPEVTSVGSIPAWWRPGSGAASPNPSGPWPPAGWLPRKSVLCRLCEQLLIRRSPLVAISHRRASRIRAGRCRISSGGGCCGMPARNG